MSHWELEVFEEENGDVVVVTMDVAKSNVFSLANMDAMDRALDRIENDEQFEATYSHSLHTCATGGPRAVSLRFQNGP